MIKIRKATAEDAYEIQNVFYKTWLTTYPDIEYNITKEDIEEHFKNSFTEETLSSLSQKIRDIPKISKMFVAEYENKIIGVCRIFIRENFNQLQAIYILPEYQGRGVGKLFWSECLKYFDKNKNTIVQVATYNKNAIRFYENLGFKDSGKRFSEERHRMPISKSLIPEMEMIIN